MSLAQAKTAQLKQTQLFTRLQSSSKTRRGPKSTTIAAYSGVFLLVISMVAIGYQPPQKTEAVASTVSPATAVNPVNAIDQPSVDEIVATNVASGIATRANLPIATNIANQSVSLAIQSELAQSDTTAITKPQIVQLSADNRTIKEYVAVKGDTVQNIAKEFGLSADTVRWANNLASNDVKKGTKLVILPVDGVLYTVKSGDTIDSIATKFNTTDDVITSFNDLELSGLVKNTKIILPSGVLPATERPGYQAPAISSFTTNVYSQNSNNFTSYRYAGGFAGGDVFNVRQNFKRTSPGNTNAWGNCTWYAWERRAEMGRPIPGGAMGHAAQWNTSFAAMGYKVNTTPSVGAIFQNGGGYGHVGIVEAINSDGSITVSEMNNYSGGGFNGINDRYIPANQVSSFNYIH